MKQNKIQFQQDNLVLYNQLKEHFPDLMAQTLSHRNINDLNSAFFDYKALHYNKLKDIEKAVKELYWAFKNNQKIVIVADYDCDGATSCAIAYKVLQKAGCCVDFVVPNRMVHGYGISPAIVELCAEKEADLIVTVDNGIVAFDGINEAIQQNMKIIVTDHHLQGREVPLCHALVNPNQNQCSFESKNIAGCGVIFYVMAAFKDYLVYKNEINDFSMAEFMDLLTIGTIADVVQMDHNNRILAWQGLKKLRQNPSCGIKALIDVSNIDYQTLSTKDIGFNIAPKLNAAGRIADMSIGIDCLIETDYDSAYQKACNLDDINKQRKDKQNVMLDQADWDTIESNDHNFSKIVYNNKFHEGIIGIVAGRLKEKYYAPSIVFAPGEQEQLKGSCRSIDGFHIRDALDEINQINPDIISKFGGHAMAAGLTINTQYFDEFKNLFEQLCQKYIPKHKRQAQILIDAQPKGQQLNYDLLNAIKYYLWGTGFEEPVFYGQFKVKNVKNIKNKHLSLTVEKDSIDFDAMWFFAKHDIEDQSYINMVYQLDEGLKGLMLSIIDVV